MLNRAQQVQDYHAAAMRLADLGDKAQKIGVLDLSKGIYAEALLQERCAANLLTHLDQPTRPVLYRSAAWLAVNAGKLKEATTLANEGLEGCMYPEIAEELREVQAHASKLLEEKTS